MTKYAVMASNAEMDAHQQFHHVVFHWLRIAGLLMGQDILNDHFRVHAYTIVVLAIVSTFTVGSAWTFCNFVDETALNGGSYIFISIKVVLKYILVLRSRREINGCIALLDAFYRKYSAGSQSILLKFCKLLKIVMKSMFIYYAAVTSSAIATTIMLNIIFKPNKFKLLPLCLPGMPMDTDEGFELDAIWQFIGAAYVEITFAFYHVLSTIFVLHVLPITEILCQRISTCNEMASQEPFRSDREYIRMMKILIEQHIEMRL